MKKYFYAFSGPYDSQYTRIGITDDLAQRLEEHQAMYPGLTKFGFTVTTTPNRANDIESSVREMLLASDSTRYAGYDWLKQTLAEVRTATVAVMAAKNISGTIDDNPS